MLLDALRTKLQVVTGTDIGEVIFDWSEYFDDTRNKIYPLVLWSLDGVGFEKDIRTLTIQKTKVLTLTVFIIGSYNESTEDKINIWDTIEAKLDVYLNKVNETSGLTIENIAKLKGIYYGPDATSPDKELGVSYRDVELKLWC